MAHPFVSIVDLEEYLGYTVDTDKAKIALDSACEILRTVCSQDLDFVADDVVILDSDGSDTLLLPELPVYEVASVVGPGSITLVEGTDYVVYPEDGLIRTKSHYSTFQRSRGDYTVTYTHGYVSDSTVPGLPANVIEWPSSVRIVALQLATRIYDQGIVSSESVGGVSMSYAAPESIVLTDRERSLVEKATGVGRRR